MGLSVDVKRLRAHRQRGLMCSDALMAEAVQSQTPFSFAILPSVGPETPSVRIYGPDGALLETVSAEEFRRRTLKAEEGRKACRSQKERATGS